MPVCGTDPSHRMSEWWRRNELGRWYDCEDCGTTVLEPNARYRLLLLAVRSRRTLRRVHDAYAEARRHRPTRVARRFPAVVPRRAIRRFPGRLAGRLRPRCLVRSRSGLRL